MVNVKLRENYVRALEHASLLHLLTGLFRLIIIPKLNRNVEQNHSGLISLILPEAFRNSNRDPELNYECRQYEWFLIVYGLMLKWYSAYGTYTMQRYAIGIETFRVSFYAFITILDDFNFDSEENDNLFSKGIWNLIGMIGLLANICALFDEKAES
jgi:hypothetical protein